jgi:hypothetical protein
LTEKSVGRTLFDRKFISPKGHLVEKVLFWKRSFDRNFFRQKNVIWPKKIDRRSFDRNFIWPKSHLTEKSRNLLFFSDCLFWIFKASDDFLLFSTFSRKVIFRKFLGRGHLTEKSCYRKLFTFHIWNMESIGFICNFLIVNFHVLGLFEPKKQVYSKNKNSVCHAALPSLPFGRWSKFVSTIFLPS